MSVRNFYFWRAIKRQLYSGPFALRKAVCNITLIIRTSDVTLRCLYSAHGFRPDSCHPLALQVSPNKKTGWTFLQQHINFLLKFCSIPTTLTPVSAKGHARLMPGKKWRRNYLPHPRRNAPFILQCGLTPRCHFILLCTDLENAFKGSASGRWLEGHGWMF